MDGIIIHKPPHFAKMREVGALAAACLERAGELLEPGIATQEINDFCHKFIIDHGGIPAPLHYKGYPRSICTSVNHVVCHGIPGDEKLWDGDIINIDITIKYKGWHGDTSATYAVGKISPTASKLLEVTAKSLEKAINLVKPGTHLGSLGAAIQKYVEGNGFSVVRRFCGHGLGRSFHSPPEVLHHGKKGSGLVLQEGMFFTIEPMVNIGTAAVMILEDGWTSVTEDRSLSAQFEHSVGVTADGCEVFTRVGTPRSGTPPKPTKVARV